MEAAAEEVVAVTGHHFELAVVIAAATVAAALFALDYRTARQRARERAPDESAMTNFRLHDKA